MILINTQKEMRLATIVIYILLILVILICVLASYYSKKGKIPIPVDGTVRIVCRVPMDKNKMVEVVVNLSNTTLEFCPNGLWIASDETYKVRGQLIGKSEIVEVIIENDKNEIHIENIKGHWSYELSGLEHI